MSEIYEELLRDAARRYLYSNSPPSGEEVSQTKEDLMKLKQELE